MRRIKNQIESPKSINELFAKAQLQMKRNCVSEKPKGEKTQDNMRLEQGKSKLKLSTREKEKKASDKNENWEIT